MAVGIKAKPSQEVATLSEVMGFGASESDRLIVHLGNLGVPKMPEKSLKYSERFPNFGFFGIDMMPLDEGSKAPPNFRQIRSDFVDGLGRFRDGSISLISSEMAVGYYTRKGDEYTPMLKMRTPMSPTDMELFRRRMKVNDSVREYTLDTIRTAHTKLREGGKLLAVVDDSVVDFVKEAMVDSGFAKERVSETPIAASEGGRTPWMGRFLKHGHKLYQLSAQK
jgi:hypothetical protein